MLSFTLPRTARITRTHKVATAVLVAAGATTALAVTAQPSTAQPTAAHTVAAVKPVSANGMPAAVHAKGDAPKAEHPAIVSVAAQVKAKEAPKQAHAAKRTAPKAEKKQYANNLDGWIRQSLDIMKSKGIPGSYDGLHRNIMRESSGNPNAVNDWDINAINGIPSKGLLQVIQPTFDTYHVSGTANKLTDPVANITAAANYAADRYGSIDNVNSAY
ncbi:transglycosylase SLT domain-containing protein [Streptomyces sp. NPDC053427]|uniref:transglycosylase SLT domain-containing protein n=1 Tax=Streptomyces sp. NPDC053427 TaxID=3365701 RepID=UPI0037D80579